MPQAIERSLATPMTRPRLPCISVPLAGRRDAVGHGYASLRLNQRRGSWHRAGPQPGKRGDRSTGAAACPTPQVSELARIPDRRPGPALRVLARRGRADRAERPERHDARDRCAGRAAVGADRAAEGRGSRAASCSTPTSRAARATSWRPIPTPHCCSTGRRSAGRCASRAGRGCDGGGGGRLFRVARPHLAPRRLAPRAVASAALPRSA